MSRLAMIAALALAAAAPSALGQAAHATYTGIETSSETIRPPDAGATRWTFQACPTCRFVTLKVDANSVYYVGKTQVPLEVLRRYAARGPAGFNIYYEDRSMTLMRAVLRTELDAADRAARPPGKR